MGRRAARCLAAIPLLLLAAGAAPPAPPAAAPRLPAGPINLDFEQGDLHLTPPGWSMTAESERRGFGVELTDEQPFEGQYCALVHTVAMRRAGAGSGTLVQMFDAASYRGRQVRFRAAVHVEPGSATHARLFVAVQLPGGRTGAFDDMADRPITASEWRVYETAVEVAPDATAIAIGMTVTGDGRAWIDAASFTALGPAAAAAAPPHPLDRRALANLVALARLTGYVRYFHPSDQAAAADWDRFTAAAVAQLDPAPGAPQPPSHAAMAPPSNAAAAPAAAPSNAAELAAALGRLFAPLAPTLRLFPTGTPPPRFDLGLPVGTAAASLHQVSWNHIGLGAEEVPSLFSSARQRSEPGQTAGTGLDPLHPWAADLGGGVSCLLPLALYADDRGTLPHAPIPGFAGSAGFAGPSGSAASAAAAPPGPPLPATLDLADRNSRLAIVILVWNVLQHFDPALPAARQPWDEALAEALRAAAAGSDTESLLAALRRMVAASGDGQAVLAAANDPRASALPIRWDEVEDRLVVTEVAATAAGAAAPAAPGTLGAPGAPDVPSPTGAPGFPGSPGTPGFDTAGLHPGDEVVRIDGRPAAAALESAAAEVAAATPQGRRWRALQRLLLGAAGAPVRLEVRPAPTPKPAGGARASAAAAPATPAAAGNPPPAPLREVTLVHGLAPRDLESAFPHPEALREPRPGVLVVDLAHLSDTALTEALPRLAQASGIVFDLRGYVRAPQRLLAHLLLVAVSFGPEMVPHWTHPDRRDPTYTPAATQVAPQPPLVRTRVAFLSSPRDIGAAESFLAAVAEYRLGPIVGAPTGGATGTVDSTRLPGGLTLVWTATRPAAGSPSRGQAVQPTVPAAPTRHGLAAGRDEVLEKALALVAAPAASAASPTPAPAAPPAIP